MRSLFTCKGCETCSNHAKSKKQRTALDEMVIGVSGGFDIDQKQKRRE